MSNENVHKFVDALIETMRAGMTKDESKKYTGPTNLQITYNELESPPKQSPSEIFNQYDENFVRKAFELYIEWLKTEHPEVYNERRSDIRNIVQKA